MTDEVTAGAAAFDAAADGAGDGDRGGGTAPGVVGEAPPEGWSGAEGLVRICDAAGLPRGTGFLADDHGTVITSHEAVDGPGRIVLQAPGGRTWCAEAADVTPLPEVALALVRTDGLGLRPLPVAVREGLPVGTYVRLLARGWRQARVLGAGAGVTYSAAARSHVLPVTVELAIGTAGRDALGPGGGAGGGPVLDAATGAVLAVLGTALKAEHRSGIFALPLRAAAAAAPGGPLARLLDRNSATVPGYGADMNLAGALELTATTVGSACPAGGPGAGPDPEPVVRPALAAALAAFTAGDRFVLGLVGNPGTGRTTALAGLTADRAGDPRPAPTLWLRGADLREDDASLADAVSRALASAVSVVMGAGVGGGTGAWAGAATGGGFGPAFEADAGVGPRVGREPRMTSDAGVGRDAGVGTSPVGSGGPGPGAGSGAAPGSGAGGGAGADVAAGVGAGSGAGTRTDVGPGRAARGTPGPGAGGGAGVGGATGWGAGIPAGVGPGLVRGTGSGAGSGADDGNGGSGQPGGTDAPGGVGTPGTPDGSDVPGGTCGSIDHGRPGGARTLIDARRRPEGLGGPVGLGRSVRLDRSETIGRLSGPGGSGGLGGWGRPGRWVDLDRSETIGRLSGPGGSGGLGPSAGSGEEGAAERVCRVAGAAGRPLLVVLDTPEEMPPYLSHRLAAWTEATVGWLRSTGTRLVVATRPEYWERAGALYPPEVLHTPARPGRRLPAALPVEDLDPDEAETARARYGIPADGVQDADARHPLTLRLLAGIRAAGVTAGCPGRDEVFGAHLDLVALRVAVRIATSGAVPPPAGRPQDVPPAPRNPRTGSVDPAGDGPAPQQPGTPEGGAGGSGASVPAAGGPGVHGSGLHVAAVDGSGDSRTGLRSAPGATGPAVPGPNARDREAGGWGALDQGACGLRGCWGGVHDPAAGGSGVAGRGIHGSDADGRRGSGRGPERVGAGGPTSHRIGVRDLGVRGLGVGSGGLGGPGIHGADGSGIWAADPDGRRLAVEGSDGLGSRAYGDARHGGPNSGNPGGHGPSGSDPGPGSAGANDSGVPDPGRQVPGRWGSEACGPTDQGTDERDPAHLGVDGCGSAWTGVDGYGSAWTDVDAYGPAFPGVDKCGSSCVGSDRHGRVRCGADGGGPLCPGPDGCRCADPRPGGCGCVRPGRHGPGPGSRAVGAPAAGAPAPAACGGSGLGGVYGPGVRRLAARVAGRVHEAARLCLAQGRLDRDEFEDLFPRRTGWASAVLTEGLFVPAGPGGYRFAHEELSDWIQAGHLDVPTALDALVHSGPAEPGPPVPRHRVGPVLEALRRLPPPEIGIRLTRLVGALNAFAEETPAVHPDRVWWAGRLLRESLLRAADATPHLPVLHALAEHVARAGSEEFGGWFWNRLRLSEADRLDLLRRLLPADHRYLDAAARRLVRDPRLVQPLLCGWFTDERRLRERPGATVATAAQALLHTHRGPAVDELTEALVSAAHHRADELLAALTEDEPSALCRAVDRWAHDERPGRRVAAAAYGLATAPHVRTPADRELLRHAALALLARPTDGALHGSALGILLRDPQVRARYLPDALACFRDPGRGSRLPASALVAALPVLPDPDAVFAALRARADGEVLRALAALTTPGLARRAGDLVREHLACHPEDAPHAAAFVDRRLDQGPGAGSVVRPLVLDLLRTGPAPVRAELARVLGAPGAAPPYGLRGELADVLLREEGDPEVLGAFLDALAAGTRARPEARTRELLRRAGRQLLRIPGGPTEFEHRTVELVRTDPAFGALVARWLAQAGAEAAALLGPGARRTVETLSRTVPDIT
ncbi:hypothetical protein ACIPY6_28140 [Streptomyces sp. NPDC090054]|uniref:hypothetical protein n=1 Tax=Streptomyces sp. NPDC090054 TaxID=3365933 RepID=UPI00382C73E6